MLGEYTTTKSLEEHTTERGRTNLLCTHYIFPETPRQEHTTTRTGVYTKRGRGVDCVNLRYTMVSLHTYFKNLGAIAMDVYVDSNALQEQKDLVHRE